MKIFTFAGLIFIGWAICFAKMMIGGSQKEMSFIYLGMGIFPLLLLGVLLMVKRYELNDEKFIIMNYWKKIQKSYHWNEFASFNALGGDGSGRYYQGIVLNLKDGTQFQVRPTWVGNFAEMAEFISGKLPQG